jgi:alpha-D-xyloside xylohydrolase
MGEKWNKVEKTGTRATIWSADTCGTNTNDMSYKAVPVLFSTRGWGIMLHSSFRSFWEIGTFSYTATSFLVEEEKLDVFLFAAPSLKELIGLYTGLTGRASMPPKWAFGMWMSRCAYRSRKEVETIAATLRKKKIPCDVLHLDPPWMKKHFVPELGVDACDFDWNEKDFPRRREMFRQWKEQGFSTSLWINPYVPEGSALYAEAEEAGYFMKTPSGGVSRIEGDGKVGVVDFTNPDAKAWWQGHLKELLRDGGAVFKPDYGERVPEDTVFADGSTGAEMHNLYLLLYNRAVFEATREEAGYGLVWGRAGYIGSQAMPGTWAGDTQITWRAMPCCLRGGLSAGLTGISFWSHDIGGFCGGDGRPEPELYIRWAQWGLLSPFSRFHGTAPREPWEYGPEAEKIVTKYARLRYSLVPYLLAAAGETVGTGVPIMRHMALEFPDEPNVHTLDDQYMLGPSLLVAPVTVEGTRARNVYLPAGKWFDFHKPSASYEGGRFVKAAAPLTNLPLFVREGAIVPRLPGNPQHLKSGPARKLEVDVYPGGRAYEVRFEDEGAEVQLKTRVKGKETRLSVAAAPMSMKVRFIGTRAKKVTSPGVKVKTKVTSSGTEVAFDAGGGARVAVIAE